MPNISKSTTHAAYEIAKKVHEGKLSHKQGLDVLERKYEMNRNSAGDYIQNYACMAEGRRFTRTLNAYSTEYYLTKFLEEDGREPLLVALSALRQHINYYESIGSSRVRKGRVLYERFMGFADELKIQPSSYSQLVQATTRNFLQYWKPKQVNSQLATNVRLEHSGSEQLHRVNPGEIVWIVTVRPPGQLRLVGRLVVGRLGSLQETKRKFGSDVWDAKYHVIAKSGTGEFAREISLMSLARDLRFNSKRDRLAVREGKVDGKQLQSIRELSPASADAIERLWYEDRPPQQLETLIRRGGGFGNPETNKKVEVAAIKHVTANYHSRGWSVRSVEPDKCGYDLHCTKGPNEEHVEVKGTQGQGVSFIITRGEKSRAKTDDDFVLYVVTRALTSEPKHFCFRGSEIEQRFEFKALAFAASLVI